MLKLKTSTFFLLSNVLYHNINKPVEKGNNLKSKNHHKQIYGK